MSFPSIEFYRDLTNRKTWELCVPHYKSNVELSQYSEDLISKIAFEALLNLSIGDLHDLKEKDPSCKIHQKWTFLWLESGLQYFFWKIHDKEGEFYKADQIKLSSCIGLAEIAQQLDEMSKEQELPLSKDDLKKRILKIEKACKRLNDFEVINSDKLVEILLRLSVLTLLKTCEEAQIKTESLLENYKQMEIKFDGIIQELEELKKEKKIQTRIEFQISSTSKTADVSGLSLDIQEYIKTTTLAPKKELDKSKKKLYLDMIATHKKFLEVLKEKITSSESFTPTDELKLLRFQQLVLERLEESLVESNRDYVFQNIDNIIQNIYSSLTNILSRSICKEMEACQQEQSNLDQLDDWVLEETSSKNTDSISLAPEYSPIVIPEEELIAKRKLKKDLDYLSILIRDFKERLRNLGIGISILKEAEVFDIFLEIEVKRFKLDHELDNARLHSKLQIEYEKQIEEMKNAFLLIEISFNRILENQKPQIEQAEISHKESIAKRAEEFQKNEAFSLINKIIKHLRDTQTLLFKPEKEDSLVLAEGIRKLENYISLVAESNREVLPLLIEQIQDEAKEMQANANEILSMNEALLEEENRDSDLSDEEAALSDLEDS